MISQRLFFKRFAACGLPHASKTLPRIGKAHMDIVRIIIAIFIPPLGVFLQEGLGKHFWINLILTLLGYIPGIIHALWIILRR